jgi:methanogenic corrinoid protein MtbC1
MSDPPESHEARISEIGRAYAEALLSGDEVAAEVAIRDALEAKLSTAEIDDEIIAPALWLIGELWQRREISVAEEHIATEISLRVLALQREAQRLVRARGKHLVMLAAPSGEQHVVALRMVGNLLREAAYDVVMIGADVPPQALAAAARHRAPDAICLSSTMPGGTDQLLMAMHEVQSNAPATAFIVGGRSLTSRLQARAGIAVCERVSDVVGAVDALIKRAALN